MADPDPSPELKGPTVAACANQCLESFQQCLNNSASSVHPRQVSMVEDQLARFSSWASSIGVFAPGSASMDHRLRYASEVQSVVTGLLESLNYRVQTCSKALAQLAESSTTDVFTTANDQLGQSFLDIAAEITRLNKISNTIRRASKDTQVLKASNFQIKDDEGENAEPLLLSHFEHHIGDWFPAISKTIRQRLAQAMLLRRKIILYRRHRQGDTSIRSENTISQASVTLPDAQPAAESSLQTTSKEKGEKAAVNKPTAQLAPSQVKSATTLAPEKFKMVSSSPSVVSASKTIASGKHQVLTYPPAPGFAAKRRYEKLKNQRIVEAAEKSTEQSLQELLKSDLQAIGEITCPYCLHALPAAEVFDERKWQNHVKNDLNPYICIFEDCNQPDVLYTHSDEWLDHLHQHCKVWRCSTHREVGPFSTLEDYMKHMREIHDTKLSDRQLRLVANRNSRKTTKLFSSCPLCGRNEPEGDGRLEDHLAGHLRSLALKSLPSYQDEIPDDVGDGKTSVDGSRPQSRGTLREMEEEKEEMLQEGAGSFWDHRTPQLTQDIPVNFLGDIYFELDLEDSEARANSLAFDTMGFKGSSENVDDDPILQSMLQQLARTEVINVGIDGSSNLSAEQRMATSSKPPMSETSEQDELLDAIPQKPVNVETSHAQSSAKSILRNLSVSESPGSANSQNPGVSHDDFVTATKIEDLEQTTEDDGIGSYGRMSLYDEHEQTNEREQKAAEGHLKDLIYSMGRYINPNANSGQNVKKPIKVAIIDSGVDLDDSWIRARSSQIAATRNWTSSQADDCADTCGHGTHITRLISKIAPTAEMYIAKVSKRNKFDPEVAGQVAQAIEWAVGVWKVDIISLSMAMDGEDPRIKKALDKVISPPHNSPKKVLVMAAASNWGGNRHIAFPASCRGVICVHSTDGHGNPSNTNPTAQKGKDFAVLGMSIKSSIKGKDKKRTETYISGTSFATAIGVGIAANVLEIAKGDPTLWDGANGRLCSSWGMSCVFRIMSEERAGYRNVMPWRLFDGRPEEDVYREIKNALEPDV